MEFKESKAESTEIGQYISALSNSAALAEKTSAYLVWGIQDTDHTVVGTHFRPHSFKVGNEELENWLLRLLTPKIDFKFSEILIDGKTVVILEIDQATRHPVQFEGQEFIRIGSYKKRLKDFPEKERELWRIFDRIPFENGIAADSISDTDVILTIDFGAYFKLLHKDAPQNKGLILEALEADQIINSNAAGKWDVTNLGAILFARDLSAFNTLRRKTARVIQYSGNTRVRTLREVEIERGYGAGFEELCVFINRTLPSSEVIRMGLRNETTAYPDLAVRELLANTLIHQDFSITGAGPMIEIFEDRIEFTNPGAPIVKTERFLDTPPRSRNEAIASLMRRIGICEERGSGWDKVVFLTELHQLPAPLVETSDATTRVVLFAHRELAKMDKEDRTRALYLHASLKYVNREHMTNKTVRDRFGIASQNSSIASRLIRDAVEAGYILPYDPEAAPKLMRYLPFWAAPNT